MRFNNKTRDDLLAVLGYCQDDDELRDFLKQISDRGTPGLTGPETGELLELGSGDEGSEGQVRWETLLDKALLHPGEWHVYARAERVRVALKAAKP